MSRGITQRNLERKTGEHRVAIESLSHRPGSLSASFHIKVFTDTGTITTGDGKFIFGCSRDMDGMELKVVEMYVTTVSSSGIVQVQLRNITQAVDMLTTRVQVDASELDSKTAATAAVISATNDDVAWGDQIAVDVDAAGTGAKGLGMRLTFR